MLGCQHYSQMVTSLSLEVVAQVFQEFSKFTRFVVGDGKEFGYGKTFGGGTNLWDPNIQDSK